MTAAVAAAEGVGEAQKKKRSPYLLAFVVGLTAFMEVLDMSIANVALKNISGSLSAGFDESTWVLTSYLVANAIVLPMTAWFSDIFGRRRYYLISMVLFTAASAMCGLAPSLGFLIFFRILQGLAGGALQPVSQSILADAFPPEKRGMAFAIYGMAVVFGPAIGPLLGGWITDNFSWHWVFLINVPVGIFLFTLARKTVQDPPALVEARTKRLREGIKIDYLGFSLIALGMGALQVFLDKGQQLDWLSSPFIASCLTITVSCLLILVFWELRHPHPVVNFRLMRNINFSVAMALMFLLGFTMFGAILLMPQLMQGAMGYSAFDAGMVMSPAAFMMVLMMPIMGKASGRFDPRLLASIGFVLVAFSMWVMSTVNLDLSREQLIWLRVLQALGMPFLFIPITMLAYVGVPQHEMGNATSLVNLLRNIGGGVGISVAITHLARGQQIHQSHLVDGVSLLNPNYQIALQELTAKFGSEAMALASLAGEVQRQAGILAFVDDFRFIGIVAFCCVPLVWFMKRPPKTGAAADIAVH